MKNKKGFTLIEVVTTIAIVGILSVSLVSVVPQVLNSTYNTQNLAEAQIVAKSTLDVLQNELRYANYINIEASIPEIIQPGKNYITIINDKIYSKLAGGGVKAISPLNYSNYTYSVLFSTENPRVLKTDISLFFRGEKIYTLNSRIFIYNLISASITGDYSGACVSYSIPPIPSGPIATPTISGPTPTGGITATPTPVPTATPIPAPVSVSSITVLSNSNSINVNAQTMQMSASVLPENAANKGISWSVSNTALANISQSGLLSPLMNGSITVTASAMDGSGVIGTKTIIISNQVIKATSIVIITNTGSDILLSGGYTITLSALISPSNTLNKIVAWNLTDPQNTDAVLQEVGQYSCKVKSHINKTGSVFITAKTTDGSNLSSTIEIKIVK